MAILALDAAFEPSKGLREPKSCQKDGHFDLSYCSLSFVIGRGVYMKNITIQLNNYKKRLLAIDAELLTLPAGNLVVRGARYYHLVDGEEVGITQDVELVQRLFRKRYILALKKIIEKNILIISKAIGKLTNIAHEEIISTLPASYQKVETSNFFHPSVKQWLAKPQKENSYEGKKYETKNGTVLRSKSEYMIASLLEDYDILYRYEPALTLGGKTKYPDFIIIKPFTGEFIVWEHFGSLHEPGYEQKMNKKMELYLDQGLIPFKTLIYTFEFDINIRRLKSLIENIILAD